MAVIQKRGDNYRVLIRKKGHPSISKTFKLKVVAERWARETEVNMDRGMHRSDDATVEDTIHEYFTRMAKIGKPVGGSKRENLKAIARELADTSLSQLTTETIVEWISSKDIKPASRQQYVIYLRTVLVAAETLWGAKPDLEAYARASRFMRTHGIIAESDERHRRASDNEIERILEVVERNPTKIPYRDILRFQIVSAFRIGETCRLRWEDINEEDKTVIIRQRKHPRRKRDEVAPLLGEAWEIVQRQPRTSEFVFPYNPSSIGTRFRDYTLAAGVDDLRIHDLRHEAISRLFEQGYGITEVQLCSGHKDLKMLQRYLHLQPRDLHAGPVAIRRLREEQATYG